MERPLRTDTWRIWYVVLLLPVLMLVSEAARGEAAGRSLEIVSATWKVGSRPDVDITMQVAALVKEGQLNVAVRAATFGLQAPGGGRVGTLVVTYRLNGGEVESKTIRGGGSPLKIVAPPVAEAAPAEDLARGPMPFVQLTVAEPREATNGSTNGALLVRELQRQAVWMAAREELGLRTRDMVLEPFTKDAAGSVTTVLVGTQFWKGFGSDTYLALPDGTPATEGVAVRSLDIADYAKRMPGKLVVKVHETLWDKPIWIDYGMIVKDMEGFSRKEFVEGLKKAGVLGTRYPHASKWLPKGEAPAEAQAALARMDPLSQFAGIRLLDGELRRSGSSPEVIAGLVQGYANLALMTDNLYSATYKTYMARSLLYAERLVAHSKSNAHSLYVRAYARAMAGFGRLALEDLDAAKNKVKAGEAAPAWANVMEALGHYDLAQMENEAAKGSDYAPLARMLTVVIASDGYSSDKVAEEGLACLSRQPGNLWVMQELYRTQQLGMTAQMPPLMLNAIPTLLRAQRTAFNFPKKAETARLALADTSGVALAAVSAVRQSLATADAGDSNLEPPFAAMSALIADEEFQGIYGYAKYLRYNLGAGEENVAAWGTETADAWRDHPLAGLVEAAGINWSTDRPAYQAALKKVKPDDAGAWFIDEMKTRLSWNDYTARWSEMLVAEGHADLCLRDFSMESMRMARLQSDEFLAALRVEAPHAAFPVWGWLQTFHPEGTPLEQQLKVSKTVKDLLKDFSDRPMVVQPMARWLVAIHDYKGAIGLLEDQQKATPSIANARVLLDLYDLTGNLDKAKALVDSAGRLPTQGLEFAALCDELGTMLGRRYRFSEALPYNTRASDSFAAWALEGLESCQNSLGAYDTAAQLLEAEAERYEDDVMRWYAWAWRMKRPELPRATKALNAYMAKHPDNYMFEKDRALAESNPAKAIEIMRTHRDGMGALGLLEFAGIAAQAGNDGELQFALQMGSQSDENSLVKDALVALLAIQKGSDARETLLPLELGMGPMVNNHQLISKYLGEVLVATGQKREGIRFLTYALMQNGSCSEPYGQVYLNLKRMGEDPEKLMKVAQDHVVNVAALMGKWKVQDNGNALSWAFDADFTVESSDGLRGQWWESDGRVLINWSAGKWAVFTWPTGETTTGDSNDGKTKVMMTKQR